VLELGTGKERGEGTISAGAYSAQVPTEPRPEIWFKRRVGLLAAVREVWAFRELWATLVERDLRVRYKQAALGLGWAVISPVVEMVAFTVLFTKVTHIHGIPPGVPYVLFSYLGLIPWAFFSSAVSGGALSLTGNVPLLNKLYCPREVFPLSQMGDASFDALIASMILLILFPVAGFAPKIESLWLPVILLPLFMASLGVALVVSVITVYVRDFQQIVPMIIQIGLFATPVAYPLDQLIHNHTAQLVYSAINPIAPVLDSLRRTVLYGQQPNWPAMAIGGASAFLMMTFGYVIFKRLETGIADVA
jgi:ABC-2 type transport system permease protein/lipopolysaccharide transport system permease protein